MGRRGIAAFFLLLGMVFLLLISLEQYLMLKLLTLASALPVLIYLSIIYPESVLWLCLMLYFTPGAEKYGNVLLVLLGVVLLTHRLVAKRMKVRWDLVLYLWGFIWLNAAATIKNWHDWGKAARGCVHFLFMPVLIYLSVAKGLIDENGCRRLWRFYLPVTISYAVVQLLFVYLTGVNFSTRYVMATHTGINLGWGFSNTLAALMVFFAAIIISHPGFTKGGTFQRLWFYVIVFTGIATSFIIISRGAILSIILGLFMYMVVLAYMEGRFRLKKWLMSLGIFLLVAVSLFHSFFTTLILRYQNLRYDMATFGRLNLILDSVLTMSRNVLIGTGPNQHLFNDFFRHLEDPHNIFLRYGVDIGIASMVAVAVILAYPLRTLFKLRNRETDKASIIYGAFMFPYYVAICNSQIEAAITKYHYGLMFWILFSLIIRYAKAEGPAPGKGTTV